MNKIKDLLQKKTLEKIPFIINYICMITVKRYYYIC